MSFDGWSIKQDSQVQGLSCQDSRRGKVRRHFNNRQQSSKAATPASASLSVLGGQYVWPQKMSE